MDVVHKRRRGVSDEYQRQSTANDNYRKLADILLAAQIGEKNSLAGAVYQGKSDAKNAGATTKTETPKMNIVVTRSIPRSIIFPVPPWYIKIRSGGPAHLDSALISAGIRIS